MKKILAMTLIFCFFTLLASAAFAQPQQRMKRVMRSFERPLVRILAVLKANQEELDITDDQIEQVQNIVFSHKEKTIKMKGEQSMSRLELQKLMLDRESLDYDRIKAVLADMSAIRNDMFIDGLRMREEIGNVLTPEQRQALKDIRRRGMRNRPLRLKERLQQRIPGLRNRIHR